MIANAVELYLLAIEKEAFVYVELDRANTENCFVRVDDHTVDGVAVLLDCGEGGIEIWLLHISQLWVGDVHRLCTTIACLSSVGLSYRILRQHRLARFVDFRMYCI